MRKLLLISTTILLLIAFDCFGYKQETVRMPMSDGVKLYTVIWYPNDMQADEKLPAVLVRTIYGAGTANANASSLPKNIIVDNLRYIFIEQDIRGTTNSPGKFLNGEDDGWLKNKDGYDAIDWITKQKWSNGKVCMYGLSNSAHSQYYAIATQPQNLLCGFANSSAWDSYLCLFYPGGLFSYLYYDWMTYTMGSPEVGNMMRDSSSINTEFFKYRDFSLRKEKFNIPIFHLGGWYDYIQGPSAVKAFYDVNYYGGENAKGKQKLMIGPWEHWPVGNNYIGALTFPQSAIIDVPQLAYDWFYYWVNDKKDNRIKDYPNISLYLMGPVDTAGYWNNWLYYQNWPFDDTDTMRFYLSNDGIMTEQNTNESSKILFYDPDNPFVGRTGAQYPETYWGPQDWNLFWNDNKVLTFSSPVCTEAYDIFGKVELEVYMSSDREDTDIIAQLVDIYPDGRKMSLNFGCLKARYRNGFDRENFLVPGEKARLVINMNYFAYTMLPGHRLGILITSSLASIFHPNPNTSDPVNKAKDTLIANNTFHFGGDNATVLILPIRKPGAVSVNETIKKQDISISPNPFSESTTINYELQTAGRVKIDIFNSIGEKIATLVDEWQDAGKHNEELRMNNEKLPAGMYYCRIQIGERIESRKLLFIK